MNPDYDFQRQMVEYLESVHMDEFITWTKEDVKKDLDIAELDNDYKNPTKTLPTPPPSPCNQDDCSGCKSCIPTNSWQNQFNSTVDDRLFHSNLHKCTGSIKQYQKRNAKNQEKKAVDKYQPITGCLSNKWGKCKACFPHKT